jgi:putative Holliday junction resolvase
MTPLLGIDYGPQRIGLAISDPTGTISTALGTHRRDRDGPLLPFLQELVRKHEITQLVIGLPLTADGRQGEMAQRVRRFVDWLEENLQLPVVLIDERFSSQEATGYLRMGKRRRRPKEEIDAVAAALILQTYLDHHAKQAGDQSGDRA